MALITCPECGREVSDRAKTCPNCGFPITKSEEMDNELQVRDVVLAKEEQKPQPQSKKKVRIGLVATLCVVLAMLAFFLLQTSGSVVGTWEDTETLDGYIFIYEFDKDGGFSSSFQEKGSDFLVPGGVGQYEIEGDSLHITMSTGEETTDKFSVKGNELIFGNQTLKRIKNEKDENEVQHEEKQLTEDELAAISVCQQIKDCLKNPSSLSLNAVICTTDETDYSNYIFVDFSAQNGFGGTNRTIWVYRNGSFYASADDDDGKYDFADSTRDFCRMMGYHYVSVDTSVIEENLY